MERSCKNCIYKTLYENAEPCKSCSIDADKFEPKPQTNRQWLESLSDEQFLKKICLIERTCGCCAYYYYDNCYHDCTNGRSKWLQAEHKE